MRFPEMLASVHVIPRARLILVAALIIVAFPSVPAAKAEDWRFLSGDGKTVTSDCIGKPVTPTCIVDTLVACDVLTPDVSIPDRPEQAHPACYSLAWIAPGGFSYTTFFDVHFRGGLDQNLVLYQYRVTTSVLTEPELPRWASLEGWRAGDLAVDVWQKYCRPEDVCLDQKGRPSPIYSPERCPPTHCYESEEPLMLILRREKYRWIFIGQYDPYRLGSGDYGRWKRK